MKAMILAAGRGTRLKPLTDHTPKPLLPVKGEPLVAHLLRSLAAAGVTEIVMNVSYLADKIQTALGDGRAYGVRIQYSVEPEPLETGGGVYHALPLLGQSPFLLVSADIHTDFPWERLIAQQTTVTHAHLIVVNNPSYHQKGDFYLQEGRVLLQGQSTFTYANLGVFHPRLFEKSGAGFFKLTDVLIPAIAQGVVTGEKYAGKWSNIGTVEELQQLQIREHAL